jgi:hypothetical protein
VAASGPLRLEGPREDLREPYLPSCEKSAALADAADGGVHRLRQGSNRGAIERCRGAPSSSRSRRSRPWLAVVGMAEFAEHREVVDHTSKLHPPCPPGDAIFAPR